MRYASWMLAWFVLVCATAAESHAGNGNERSSLRRTWDRHGGYRARVYTGVYYRWPYDYRIQFDYPWYAGPSRGHWPIAEPQPAVCDPGPTIIATPYQ